VSSRPAAHILRGCSDGALSSAGTAASAVDASSVFSEEPLFSGERSVTMTQGATTRIFNGSGAAVGKRDTSYSSLHSVSKLLTAKLGRYIRCLHWYSCYAPVYSLNCVNPAARLSFLRVFLRDRRSPECSSYHCIQIAANICALRTYSNFRECVL
jgi:hypothetical protein